MDVRDWLCPFCEHILDPSVLGLEEAADDEFSSARAERTRVVAWQARPEEDPMPPDALILGDVGIDEGDFSVVQGIVAEPNGRTSTYLFYTSNATSRIVHPEAVPILSKDRGSLPCTPYEEFILSCVDGKRSVRDIQKLSGLAPEEVAITVLTLLDKGVMRFDSSDSESIRRRRSNPKASEKPGESKSAPSASSRRGARRMLEEGEDEDEDRGEEDTARAMGGSTGTARAAEDDAPESRAKARGEPPSKKQTPPVRRKSRAGSSIGAGPIHPSDFSGQDSESVTDPGAPLSKARKEAVAAFDEVDTDEENAVAAEVRARSSFDARPPRASSSIRRVAKPRRDSRVEHAERPEKSESHERPEKSGRIERPEKSGRIERPEGSGAHERPEKSGRVERPEKSGAHERPEKSGAHERPEKSGAHERPEKSGRIERPEKSGRIERPEKSGRIERPEKSERIEKRDEGGSPPPAEAAPPIEKIARERAKSGLFERVEKSGPKHVAEASPVRSTESSSTPPVHEEVMSVPPRVEPSTRFDWSNRSEMLGPPKKPEAPRPPEPQAREKSEVLGPPKRPAPVPLDDMPLRTTSGTFLPPVLDTEFLVEVPKSVVAQRPDIASRPRHEESPPPPRRALEAKPTRPADASDLFSTSPPPPPPGQSPTRASESSSPRPRALVEERDRRKGGGSEAKARGRQSESPMPEVVKDVGARKLPDRPSGVDGVRMSKAQKLYDEALKEKANGNVVSARMNMKLALTFDPSNELYQRAFDELSKASGGANAPVQGKSRARELYDAATEAEETGDVDRAIDFLEKALHESREPAFYNRLGVIVATKKFDFLRAQKLIETAIELAPGNTAYQHNLAKILSMEATFDVKSRSAPAGDKKAGILSFLGRKR